MSQSLHIKSGNEAVKPVKEVPQNERNLKIQGQGSQLFLSQPSQTLSTEWKWLSGVHHPKHITPLLPFPGHPGKKPVGWSDHSINNRPAFFPSGEIGHAAIQVHFFENVLKPHQDMKRTTWWDRLIACYNTIGRIDRRDYLTDFDLRLFLQVIQEDAQHKHGFFWTPSYAMLDQDNVSILPRRDRDAVLCAKLVAHLIRFDDGDGHFAVLIYDHSSKRWIFADSWSSGREDRFKLACQRLRRWLVESELAPPQISDTVVQKRGTLHHITEQSSSWTCGLVAIDFVRAFMREGLDDWAASYGRKNVEEKLLQRWSDWLRCQLGHAPNTDVRKPRVAELSHHDFIRKHWPHTKTPPPSVIEAGRSRNTPITISPSPPPLLAGFENPTGLLNTLQQSRPTIGTPQNMPTSSLNHQRQNVIPNAAIGLSNPLPLYVSQPKSSVGLELQNTPYRHSVTPERSNHVDSWDRLSPSHPPDWPGWNNKSSRGSWIGY